MLVVSDNKSWKNLQIPLGDGDEQKGRAAVQAFGESLGLRSRVWLGMLGNRHGNEISACDAQLFSH